MAEANEVAVVKSSNTSESGSIITSDTVISGDVNSNSAIKVYGEVKGKVTSTKVVDIYGKVVGDISGETVNLIKGKINGNIQSKSKVKIDKDVILIGDVKAVDLEASGKIKGTIEVDNLVVLENTTVCEGSITAALINIKTGAKIKGPITVFDADAKDFEDIKVKTPKV